ncbi:MAG: GntR family transcriptional regulator [Trueperaceae bacterium]|nr:GntR family transcriptional regulator [Trueperaceae bacterium]
MPRPPPLFLTLDRELPVSIHAQLVGQIEYGVSSGRLPPGSQLPSVRELAEQLAVSPVTVSHVFRTLRERDLIETVPGRGTFVATKLDRPGTASSHLPALHRAVDDLIRVADGRGVSRDELAGMVSLRLRQDTPPPAAALRVRFVGIYAEATWDYARDVQRALGPNCRVDAVLFDELQGERGAATQPLQGADLLLTFPHRRADLERLVGERPPIGVVRFIPSARVRTRLAELSPFTRVGLVSAVPEFLPTFLKGVRGFAQHVREIHGTVQGADDLDALLQASDLVIYATGTEEAARHLPPQVPSFEYRHVPDPVWLDEHVAPLVATLARPQRTADVAPPAPTTPQDAVPATRPRFDE